MYHANFCHHEIFTILGLSDEKFRIRLNEQAHPSS